MFKSLLVVVFMLVSTSVYANSVEQDQLEIALIALGNKEHVVPAPVGFSEMCLNNHITVCDKEQYMTDHEANLHELKVINELVNKNIKYAKDIKVYGRQDYWAIPESGVGDCEDFALTKLYALYKLNWNPHDLRLALGYNHNANTTSGMLGATTGNTDPAYHAVLIAKVNGVEYVLDNERNDIYPLKNNGKFVPHLVQKYGTNDWVLAN